MKPAGELQQGSIVWARVVAPNGETKERPVLIITADSEIAEDAPIVGLAITTSFGDPPPPNHFPLPWSRTGGVATGLRRRSAVVCDWAVVLQIRDILEVKGHAVPAILAEVLRLRQSLSDAKHT